MESVDPNNQVSFFERMKKDKAERLKQERLREWINCKKYKFKTKEYIFIIQMSSIN